MALKQIQVYVVLSIALLVSSSLLTEKAQARVQALSFISEHEGTADLYLIDSTGQNLRKLDTNKAKKGGEHAWSPDGQWIAYAFQRIGRKPAPGEALPGDEVFGDSAIHLVKATGGLSDPIEIANELSLWLSPEWVPEAFLPVSPRTEKQIIPWGRLKREEKPELREISLLQRSNISIERDSSLLALQRSAMSANLSALKKSIGCQKLYAP